MGKVAVVQRPAVLLNRGATLARVVEAIEQAAGQGAALVVFPEAYVPGYPDWIWRLRPYPDASLHAAIHARLVENSVDLSADQLAPVRAAARHAGVSVLLGVHERDGSFSRTTLYNTAVLIGPDGQVRNRHRKLVPTNPERMVWGQGDAAGLRVLDTPVGRVGVLICWETYMPLARYALYAEGVELLVSMTWDHGEVWRATCQHIAKEGRSWVIAGCMCLHARDVPDDFPGRAQLYSDADEWINPGDSLVVDPTGAIVAGPLHREPGILYADCDPTRVASARRTFDPAGHYARPDVFRLEVKREPAAPIIFSDATKAPRN
jgi:nitrilase